MLVTREADYAIRCVIEVARHGRISAARVAALQGISPTFLGKIVQSLAKAGILATRRGVGGGIALAQPVEAITLLQVIEAVEGPLTLNECLTSPPQCGHIEICPAYPYLCQAQDSLREILDVSFAEVMDRMPEQAAAPAMDMPVMAGAPVWSPDGARVWTSDGEPRRSVRGDAL
jgi:Rrf2 family protein